MIVYDKFWETMTSAVAPLTASARGKALTTAKLDDFCQIFHCRVEDLITYVEPADGEPHSPYSEKSPK